MIFKAPHLTREYVGDCARSFLEKYHRALQLPIPIEWIIENDLGLHIHPLPNLYRIFRQNGFLSRSRTTIYVDEYQYDNFIEKYRFTLAHEIGHFVLHEELYAGLSFDSEQEFIEWLQSCPRRKIIWFESHANWFAGQVLVPGRRLEEQCVQLLDSNHDRFSESDSLPDEFWSYASNELAEAFEVSPITVETRIRYERLSEKFKNYYHKKPR